MSENRQRSHQQAAGVPDAALTISFIFQSSWPKASPRTGMTTISPKPASSPSQS